jgi:hypothetical protein
MDLKIQTNNKYRKTMQKMEIINAQKMQVQKRNAKQIELKNEKHVV